MIMQTIIFISIVLGKKYPFLISIFHTKLIVTIPNNTHKRYLNKKCILTTLLQIVSRKKSYVNIFHIVEEPTERI